ncbi:MAG TPA: MFS transporter, partial [Gaiellaceae bacterium]|nr:MFS transporter [Gaiellaceae bacterium]
ADRHGRLLAIAVGASVAVAFADSSIVVLALPALYTDFHTSLEGVSWVITSYNLVVVVGAAVLIPFTRRVHIRDVTRLGLALFLVGSIGCAASWSLEPLIVFRCVQGAGGAFLLAGALPLLGALFGGAKRGARVWESTGTFGAALGPALGGVLTQLADWRAIFVVQAPVAALALLATFDSRVHELPVEKAAPRRPGARAANAGLAFVFGGLVGALFLSVLLVITVWDRRPIAGALIVSALPAAALIVRPLASRLSRRDGVAAGAVLLAAGLVALALVPTISNALVAISLGFCGLGLGLAVPALTTDSMDPERAPLRSGTITVGARHLGLVAAVALIAPLLTHELDGSENPAILAGTRVVMDGNIPLTKKVPIALAMRDEFQAAQSGAIPDLAKPFNDRGAKTDSNLRHLRDQLLDTLRGVVTKSFRYAFLLSALFALLALFPARRLREEPSG